MVARIERVSGTRRDEASTRVRIVSVASSLLPDRRPAADMSCRCAPNLRASAREECGATPTRETTQEARRQPRGCGPHRFPQRRGLVTACHCEAANREWYAHRTRRSLARLHRQVCAAHARARAGKRKRDPTAQPRTTAYKHHLTPASARLKRAVSQRLWPATHSAVHPPEGRGRMGGERLSLRYFQSPRAAPKNPQTLARSVVKKPSDISRESNLGQCDALFRPIQAG
jgi:hypothetical protein